MTLYFDCGQCGEIGKAESLLPHDTRPMPMDLGFCPKCKSEIEELFDEQAIRLIAAEYDTADEVEVLKQLGLEFEA